MGQRFNRDGATMSNRVRQFRRRLAEDEALAEELRMLQSELIERIIEIRKARLVGGEEAREVHLRAILPVEGRAFEGQPSGGR
jgi:hypothetical protein